ncbi:MAG: DUF3794 domain-containing protein [Pygmaiobacter massiliensis]|nr:DUF3794 domain-containing protein [Pygmaiobacter massiliensis]
MELQVVKDTVNIRQQLCDLTLETPVETELVIPDYQPEIFKLVKSFLIPVVLKRQALGGKLSLEGYFRLLICYQSEESRSFCTLEQKLPFSKTAELKAAADGPCFVQVAGETEYLNVRAINQRRIDVKGAFAFRVQVSGEVHQEIITGLSGAGIQYRQLPLSSNRILTQCEKQFTAEDTLEFEKPPEAILTCQCTGSTSEVKVVSGKAVVKGSLQLSVLYRPGPGTEVLRAEKELVFSQILDSEPLPDDCICTAQVLPVGCTVMEADAAAGSLASVSALLQFTASTNEEFVAVDDAFSTQYETEAATQTVLTEQVLDRLALTVTATAEGALPDPDAAIVDCMATVLPVETVTENGELSIRGRAIAHLICRNALGELECYDKPCDYVLPKRYDVTCGAVTAQVCALFGQAHAHKSGAQASCEISILLSGTVSRKKRTELLQAISCSAPLEKQSDGAALRIYYGHAGEDVFQVAKHYHADPGKIAQDSGVETGILSQDTRLLIPCAE